MDEQPPPTYQELLAEIYDVNATNQYVVNRFYEEEEVESFAHDKYKNHEIENKEEFNKFQGNRINPDNVIKPAPADIGAGTTSYAYNKDIRTTLVNIDGRFREVIKPPPPRLSRAQCAAQAAIQSNFGTTSATEFAILLARQYKNVISVKVNSLEFENSFYTFTALNPTTGTGRDNTTFNITLDAFTGTTGPALVTIPDGNYSVDQLISTITTATFSSVYQTYGLTGTTGYTGSTGSFYFEIVQNPLTQKLLFSSNYTFSLEFPVTPDCFTKNGIGYNLGFYNTQPNESTFSSPPYTLIPDTRPDVVQDRYVYITINDWYQVHHQYPDQSELSAFIKVPLTAPKFTVQYDNISLDSDVKEYFFPQPQNIQKLEISVLDSYGALLNMQGGSFSMSFVVNEILQSSIYEKMLQL
jgi:hypothetical protein